MIRNTLLAFTCIFLLFSTDVLGQVQPNPKKYNQEDKFRQLEEILPTPNETRTASGAPAHKYWQQKVDYEIDVQIDDETQVLTGSETITYRNQSPDALRYLWLQLDGNIFKPDSDANLIRTVEDPSRIDFGSWKRAQVSEKFDGGFNITRCIDADTQKPLAHTIVKTMMRIDLPETLEPGESLRFTIDWNYNIVNARVIRARGGYEHFPADDNYLYEMAQWFPRLCAYTDSIGWQHKQFLGSGEFTLELGDYLVRITMPEDHIVASTGVLLNPDQVLTKKQRERLESAKATDKPVFIVTPDEAKANESSRSKGKKTWIFKGDQVRDFAFASSRKFIWDAWEHKLGNQPVMAMSFYPNEGEPLWSKYSTHAIIHTLNVYSRYTFDYPYPVAISVNGPVGGMEYPMICFNGPRPDPDGTYSANTKYGLISVIIHEVGHNYFPMIVNSDERQWTWMDEGLNTFLQYLSEQEWEENYPSKRGEPRDIVSYMISENQVPVMTNSESLLQFGPNAYSKPATALNILRETILGRELFDFAFKEYARRWKFKRPMPADFFRTMEDASGIDLDWFWRGWFYTTDHVDISLTSVKQLDLNSLNPRLEKRKLRQQREELPESLSQKRNADLPKRADQYPELNDFYNEYDELDLTPQDRESYERMTENMKPEQLRMLRDNRFHYLLEFENVGGLVMPVIFEVEFENGSTEEVRIPAEIWVENNKRVVKLWSSQKPVKSITLDPHLETADADLSNNHFPPKILKSRFELFEAKEISNPMREEMTHDERRENEKKQRKAADSTDVKPVFDSKAPSSKSDDDAGPETGGKRERTRKRERATRDR
jgi:hypothetical protein